MKSGQLKNISVLAWRMTAYNLKIIFANKFIWFLAGSVVFFMGISVIYVFSNPYSRMEDMYEILLFSGLLLVFYPATFGIQNDQDAKTLEILFGIPNYRYKVWLVRIILIFAIAYLIMLFYALLASVLIVKFRITGLVTQVMTPILFMGLLSFMLSTLIRNGNGTAVVMIIIGLIFLIMSDPLHKSQWNIFLNPYTPPWDVNEAVWAVISVKNRIILVTGSIIFLLGALLNLQKREKFM
jgi:hypothetical protein